MIQLDKDDALKLRDAIRAERRAHEKHEAAQLRARLDLLHVRSARMALFEELGDKYGFDSTNPFDFDSVAATLTPKPPQG